ncbi:hypothetical protein ABUW04_10505 [Streptacidiphilus sp. N1-10]|uniref:Uncharacterized protein n=1 Tax=Streptacidiphilus jeojiensis TaxID=3229225 RepID=A0ABV6XKC2_9ACTN
MGTGWLLTRRRSPYQLSSWWGPCAVPATVALGFVSMRKAVAPGPLSAGGFILAGALLVAGELLAALIHRVRRRRLSR